MGLRRKSARSGPAASPWRLRRRPRRLWLPRRHWLSMPRPGCQPATRPLPCAAPCRWRCGAGRAPATAPSGAGAETPPAGRWRARWPPRPVRPAPRKASTAQGSGPAAVSIGTTAQAATPGSCSMAASRSSGCRFTPAAVTMTSLLRPRKRSSPEGWAWARSPVASHSSARVMQRAA